MAGAGGCPSPIFFSPAITFGNIIQTAVLIFMIGGGVFAGYSSLAGQITLLSNNYARLQQQEDATRRRIDEGRAALADARAATAALAAQVQASLDHISQQIADLRVLVASQPDGRRR